MTIVEWINQILIHKTPWKNFDEYTHKTFNSYIINRWLSMDIDFIEIVNYFQKYSIGLLQPKEVYKWYCDVLPKGKRYNKYIKGKKSKKYDEWITKLLCNHFECSKLQVIEYLELINKQELKNILEMYGTNKKQIKKAIK